MRTRLVALLSALVVAVTPAAALASSRTFHDQTGEVSNSNDITSYQVTNGQRIVLRTHHRNLTSQALDIQFLLKNSANGRVYIAYASLDGKANYVGQVGAGDYAPCPGLKVTRSLAHDTAALSAPRSCLGFPKGKIRMRARVQWNLSGSKGDWAPGSGYSPWVAR